MTHLRSNHAWGSRRAGLALESLVIVTEEEKENRITLHTTDSAEYRLSNQLVYSQSLLSVRDVQAVRLSLKVPEKYTQIRFM